MKKYYYYYQEKELEVVPNAWSSELPADLLGLITEKILSSLSLSEYIRFGCVCVGWRSFSVENYQHIKLPDKVVPVLLIPIPPSLLLTFQHHKKNISFPQSPSSSSSSLCDDDDDDEEGEALCDDDDDDDDDDDEEEGEALCDDDEVEEEKGEEEHKAAGDEEKEVEVESEESEKEESDESEEEEDDHNDEEVFKWAHYYNSREIWEGQDAKQRYKNTRTFYSLSEKMVYHDFQLPVPYYKNIVGSSYGWLVTVEECYADNNGQLYLPVSLLNPFRTTDNNEIQLPPITNGNPGNIEDLSERIDDSYYLIKAFLSANPSSLSDPTTQLVVLGVYGQFRLAFCRPGDKSWTRLDLEDNYRPIQDIICYQDQFFVVLQNGYVFAFVFDAAQLLPTPIVTLGFLGPPVIVPTITYLVESGGDLLQVWRYVGCPTPTESERPTPVQGKGYITRQFLVFKLDTTGEWVEMKTLNGHMLFIGTNSSMSLLASDFPGWSKPNSIYYTDDHVDSFAIRPLEGPHDMGIFNLEDGSFERHYKPESKTVIPPPIWIQPML